MKCIALFAAVLSLPIASTAAAAKLTVVAPPVRDKILRAVQDYANRRPTDLRMVAPGLRFVRLGDKGDKLAVTVADGKVMHGAVIKYDAAAIAKGKLSVLSYARKEGELTEMHEKGTTLQLKDGVAVSSRLMKGGRVVAYFSGERSGPLALFDKAMQVRDGKVSFYKFDASLGWMKHAGGDRFTRVAPEKGAKALSNISGRLFGRTSKALSLTAPISDAELKSEAAYQGIYR